MTPVFTTYAQAGDDQSSDEQQKLHIESTDSGAGTFIVLSTERWAMDCKGEIDELCAKLYAALEVDTLPSHDKKP